MSEPADVSLPLPSSDLLLMDTKTAAVSTVLIDRLEAIAYNITVTYNIAVTAQIQPSMSEPTDRLEAIIHNITAMAQIQPSMSEPADVSFPLPSSDLLLMDINTAAMSTVVIDRLEAIAYNIATTYNIAMTAQI
jgi:hypothetical protein